MRSLVESIPGHAGETRAPIEPRDPLLSDNRRDLNPFRGTDDRPRILPQFRPQPLGEESELRSGPPQSGGFDEARALSARPYEAAFLRWKYSRVSPRALSARFSRLVGFRSQGSKTKSPIADRTRRRRAATLKSCAIGLPNSIEIGIPVALANRSRKSREGRAAPDSTRAIDDWVVPIRSATSRCVRRARRLLRASSKPSAAKFIGTSIANLLYV